MLPRMPWFYQPSIGHGWRVISAKATSTTGHIEFVHINPIPGPTCWYLHPTIIFALVFFYYRTRAI